MSNGSGKFSPMNTRHMSLVSFHDSRQSEAFFFLPLQPIQRPSSSFNSELEAPNRSSFISCVIRARASEHSFGGPTPMIPVIPGISLGHGNSTARLRNRLYIRARDRRLHSAALKAEKLHRRMIRSKGMPNAQAQQRSSLKDCSTASSL